ncbi:glycosyltransferase family 9 protein [Achromobacter aloeverae]|uniref:Glycosyl transferase n=1 Tax=Achromobacter aloeverae TaxID=1750518 RepID=A0A4Q1HG83_9BURK|nr:glycosyltransferase family 9 protein [Achromobacter aloeverae]RXN86173.1 glycosyl transferase [Achromobacter aloeverae]
MKDSRLSDDAWRDARRVLCVRLDNMGDVLMTTPAIRALRDAAPERRIGLWCSPSGAAISRMVPEIDHTVVARVPWMKVPCARPDDTLSMVEALRDGAYDAAVIFTVYSQSSLPAALACHLAGIPRVLAHCRENPYHLLSDWVPETEPDSRLRHEAQRQLDLVAHVGCRPGHARLSLSVPPGDRRRLRRKLDALGVPAASRRIVVHCGATAPSRRYPAAQYAEVIAHLGHRHGPVLLTGSSEEKALVAGIAREAGKAAVDLAGALSLGEMAALIDDAALLISNNSGPVHMAAALGTPVAVLYALTNPQHTPWEVPHRVLYHDVPCKYCYRSICPEGHHACLASVTPAEVIAAAEALLDTARPASPGAPPARLSPAIPAIPVVPVAHGAVAGPSPRFLLP